MSLLERSAALRHEAESLLTDTGIDAQVRQYGDLTYVGSYALDLMAWPDSDINVVPTAGQSIRGFMELCTRITEIPSVTRLHFQNVLDERPPGFAAGLYAGIRLRGRDSQVLWKIDLWSMDVSEAAEPKREVAGLLSRLDDEARATILATKHVLLTPEGRTPIGSGHRIYEAVLSKGLRRIEDIRELLRSEGVE